MKMRKMEIFAVYGEGSRFADYIIGKGKNDQSLHGLGGDDVMKGGIGDDQVDGGNGNDKIQGDTGDDSLLGGNGKDVIVSNGGHDTVRGDDYHGKQFADLFVLGKTAGEMEIFDFNSKMDSIKVGSVTYSFKGMEVWENQAFMSHFRDYDGVEMHLMWGNREISILGVFPAELMDAAPARTEHSAQADHFDFKDTARDHHAHNDNIEWQHPAASDVPHEWAM
jgi:hypothetical protein